MARPLSETARAKMIAATQAVVAERGVDGFTVDEVARRSGVAKTTIYRHFASGDELVLTAIDDMIGDVEVPDTGSFRGDLRATVLQFLQLSADPSLRHFFVSLLHRSLADPEFAAIHRAVVSERHTPMRLALQRAMARGEVDPSIDIQLAIHLVQGPFVVKRLIENEDVTDDEVDLLVDLVAKALAPAAA